MAEAREGGIMSPVNIDQTLAKLRDLMTPGTMGCLWCTAMLRLSLADIASNPTFGRNVDPDEADIAAEVRILATDHPTANICCEHRVKMAELEAEAAVAAA
jgi:hypothetical protein